MHAQCVHVLSLIVFSGIVGLDWGSQDPPLAMPMWGLCPESFVSLDFGAFWQLPVAYLPLGHLGHAPLKCKKFCMWPKMQPYISCPNSLKYYVQMCTKITNILATRCQISRQKCTKFNFGWGSAPDPAGGACNIPPDLLAGFKGSYF